MLMNMRDVCAVRFSDGKREFYSADRVAEANLRQSMQQAVDPLRQRATDAGNARQIVDARRLYTAQAAEVSEQRAPSRGADAGDILQRRRRARFTATRAMALYR